MPARSFAAELYAVTDRGAKWILCIFPEFPRDSPCFQAAVDAPDRRNCGPFRVHSQGFAAFDRPQLIYRPLALGCFGGGRGLEQSSFPCFAGRRLSGQFLSDWLNTPTQTEHRPVRHPAERLRLIS